MKEHRARKRFGQNFLQDTRIIQDIVNAVRPQPGDTVIEIGPEDYRHVDSPTHP